MKTIEMPVIYISFIVVPWIAFGGLYGYVHNDYTFLSGIITGILAGTFLLSVIVISDIIRKRRMVDYG